MASCACARCGACRRGLDGAALRWPWALPFVGILLTIATGPLLFPRIWHHHYGKLAFVWARSRSRRSPRSTTCPTAIAAFVHAMLGGISELHRAAVHALRGRRRHPGDRQPARHAARQYRDPRLRHLDRQRRRHHRRGHDPDPPAHRAPTPRACTTPTWWCSSSSWSPISAARSPRSAIRRCSSASCAASTSSGPAQHLWLADRDRRRPRARRSSSRSTSGYYRKDRLVTTVGESKPPIDLGVSGSINLAAASPASSPPSSPRRPGSRASASTSTAPSSSCRTSCATSRCC